MKLTACLLLVGTISHVLIACRTYLAEGRVMVFVNDRAVAETGPVPPDWSVVITNGLMRIELVDTVDQRAGVLATIALGNEWIPVTSTVYGDWTYLDSSIVSKASIVEVLSLSSDEACVRWTFQHETTGPMPGLSPGQDAQYPYPFRKTVWLRRGQTGYFTWIEPLGELPEHARYNLGGISEHEVGFGGLFGPATVETAEGVISTEATKPYHHEFNADSGTDAATLIRYGDPIKRILVPLPGGPLLIPAFSEENYGGVIIHNNGSKNYGAYLYSAPHNGALSANDVCKMAWTTTPFPLPEPKPEDLTTCGGPSR